MPQALSNSLDKLKQTSAKLNALTDEANRAFATVEKFLSENNIGVQIAVQVEAAPEESEEFYLEYRRVAGRYRIALVYGVDPNTEIVKPWPEGTRDEKLKAIAKLPELVTHISNKVAAMAVEASTAVGAVKSLLQSLEN